jgi:protein-disulfide isomerase
MVSFEVVIMQKSLALKTTLGVAAICAAGLLIALSTMRAQSPQSAAPAAAPAASPQAASSPVVAQVDGEPITAAQLDKALGPSLDKLEQQIYDMRRQQLDELIAQRLVTKEAAKRGMTVDALMAAEVTAKITPVADADVEKFYEANRARLPQQPDIKQQIRRYLENQREGERRDAYVSELRERSKVAVSLAPPPVTRVTVDIQGAPSKGPESAPVTIVEFSDFHCPFCRRVQPTLDQLLAKYPGKIRLVYKDLPLDSLHPQARVAAEAAQCAHEQGKFWPYHDKLYERGTDTSAATLTAVATEAGLDVTAFGQCLASGRQKAAVQRSLDEGEGFGATGTPTFFINGRMMSGALPLETFTRVIDEELAGTVQTR